MTSRILRRVLYIHHSRLGDGDLVFYFKDRDIGDGEEMLRSSAIQRLRRHGSSFANWYVLSTENSDYLVQMQPGTADHLARELGVSV